MLTLTTERAALSAHSSDYPQLATRNPEHDLTTLQLTITAQLTKRALQMEHERDLSSREAIYQACLLRLRPILMTTMVAVFGAPLCQTATAVARRRHYVP